MIASTDPRLRYATIGFNVYDQDNDSMIPDELVRPIDITGIDRELLVYKNTQLVISDSFYISKAGNITKNDRMSMSVLARYLNGMKIVFDTKKLLKGGVEPNPGPAKTKKIVKTPKLIRKDAVNEKDEPLCMDCAFATAFRMMQLNMGNCIDDLLDKCSSHSS